jgi:hemerythrin-like domain-containing protein
MVTGLPGANIPAPTFDDPLGMLAACHERIAAQCVLLEKLVRHVGMHGADAQAVQAARTVLRYFDTAGQHHHQDEEQDLFPQLLASADPAAAPLISRILAEHRALEENWQTLRPRLLALAESASAQLDAQVVARFNAGYLAHIALENAELLPLAEGLLDAAQRATLGRRMAARRGARV